MEKRHIDAMIEDAEDIRNTISSYNKESELNNSYKALDYAASESSNRELINWKRVRSIIEHENILTTSRLNWLFQSQSILLVSFVGLQLSVKNIDANSIAIVPLLAIPFVGLFVCLNALSHFQASHRQLSRVTEWWYKEANDLNTKETGSCKSYEAYEKKIKSIRLFIIGQSLNLISKAIEIATF